MDPDMDDVYEASIELEDGSYEYKFTLDNWAVQEEFQGGEPCTVTNGGFTNRALEVSGAEELTAVCWNSCNTCEYIPEIYDVTFNVDMSQYPSPFTNVYVSGTLNGWCGDCNVLSDPDMDGIYSLTLPLTEGSYEYKFTIDNWAVQESFAGGESCTVTNYGFTNRFLEVNDNTVLPDVCWNSCDPCGVLPEIYDVTFQVDMNQYPGGFTNVNINGTFNGWCGGCNVLTDVDMDGVYEITLPLAEGTYEYKFTLDGWDVFEEFAEGDPCTVTNGGFTNRFLELTENTVLPVVCWNSCDACPIYPAGWNGISSNVIPDTKISLEDLFAPIIDDLVVLLGKDGLFWPGQNINTIGDWDTYQGYKVKFSSGVNFEFVGTAPLDLTVALDPGICYIPVLGEGPASVEDVIAPLGDAIEFVFNIKSGEVYWPTGGIVPGVNGALEELTPGFAYLTMVNSACVLDYGIVPPKSGIENSSVSGVSCPAWNNVYSTGMQHIISVAGSNLETGDILGAFDASGHCRGLAQYNGIDAFMPLAVYGDDMTTDMKDGMGVNENMQFKIYRNGTEMDMTAIFDQTLAQHNGRFTENGLSIITELKAGATAINETDAASFNIFPNPGNGLFTITTYGDSNYEISIVDPQGRLVYSSTIKDNTRVDLTNQPKGVYFIRLTGTSSASVQKIVIR
nr:T9SS type A sorting domain-containing protein [Bacteroidota bacterium]